MVSQSLISINFTPLRGLELIVAFPRVRPRCRSTPSREAKHLPRYAINCKKIERFLHRKIRKWGKLDLDQRPAGYESVSQPQTTIGQRT